MDSATLVLDMHPMTVIAPAQARERLERMFLEHHEFIWRLLRRLGRDTDSATDLVQQAFLIAAERLSDIRPESERAFLFGTALRLSRSVARRERRCQLEGDMDVRLSSNFRPEEMAVQRRALALMDRILSKLPTELVTVFVLYELEELPMIQIAELLQIPTGTVASRLRRAREAFRAHADRAERSLRQGKSS